MWGKREIIPYLSLHCHHQNDVCIKMGSNESHFNVSVESDSMDKVTKVSTNHNLSEETGKESRSGIEPRSFRPLTSLSNALPLGQTRGSQSQVRHCLPLPGPTP